MRLGSIAFLVGLGAVATRGPRSAVPEGADAAPTANFAAVEKLINAQLAARTAEHKPQGAEEMEIAQDANATVEVLVNPLLAQAARSTGGGSPLRRFVENESSVGAQTLGIALGAAQWVKRHESSVRALLWWLPGGVLALAVLLVIFELRSAAQGLAELVGSFSRWILLWASAGSIGASALQLNAAELLPGVLFSAPPLWVLGCAAFRKILDPNAPIWNPAVFALGVPAGLNLASRLL